MDSVRIIELKESVFADNDLQADKLRGKLRSNGTLLLNVMSSPGSGKTSVLKSIIPALKEKYKIAVMEADIDGAIDAEDIAETTGVEAVQLHTGGMCHLDAGMTETGLQSVHTENPDLIFLENVGNLVCPAEFDTGAGKNVVILSIPEGDDKPHKYPLMFEEADVVLINKMDVAEHFDFDFELFEKYLRERNSTCPVIRLSAKSGEGVEELISWIEEAINEWRNCNA